MSSRLALVCQLSIAALLTAFLVPPASSQTSLQSADPSVITPWSTPASSGPVSSRLRFLQPRIVNGESSVIAGVAAILDKSSGSSFCTGTLIGCNTVLTAAHCVCFGDGDQCQAGGSELVPASSIQVYLQTGGIFDVQSIDVPSNFVFGDRSDVAVLHLADEVTGVGPFGINTAGSVANGTNAVISGFGLTNGNNDDSGILRVGGVVTSACTVVPDNPHVCWRFQNPVGAVGVDSNTCSGDSGGPLFVSSGSNVVVGGVTSGGISGDCTAPDSSWDAEVFFDRNFIQNRAGGDLGTAVCGDPYESTVGVGSGTLSAGNTSDSFQFDVPADTAVLRVALNGEDGPFVSPNNFDLYVNQGGSVSTSNFDCQSRNDGTFEFCDFLSPQSGTWSLLVQRVAGQGEFQLIASALTGSNPTTCVPDATTLCIDVEPGDQRFKATVSFDTTLGGGREGDATATPLAPLGITRGGIFSFFNATNPEMLLKVLNGCNNNGHFWVFYAATTTVGFELTVEDTQTGAVKVYTNPDLQAAEPITDTQAFATCP